MLRKEKKEELDSILQSVKTGDIKVKPYIKTINQLKKKGKLKKPCFIFGADYYVKLYIYLLRDLGVNVVGILDNDSRKYGKYPMGLPIVPVDSIVDKDATVLISSGLWRSMEAQLESMGLKEDKDFINVFKNKREWYFFPIKDLVINLLSYFKGMVVSKKVYKKYGDNKVYFFQHYLSLGDLYMASLFLPGYLGCASIEDADCVLIVLNKANYKLAKALGYQNIELITVRQRKDLLYAMWASKGTAGVRTMVYSALPASHTSGIFCNSSISFTDMFYPYLYKNNSDNKMTNPRFHPDIERIEQCFTINGLIEGKTIVISPYVASTISDISTEMWNAIVKQLKQNGYCVCTNSAGSDEPPLEGTSAVFFPFEDSVVFLERAGGFLAARNGLCEIISSAKCLKVIIYESAIVNSSFYFSLNRMGLCDDAIEYDYDGLHSKELIDNIMENFPPLK